MEDAMDIMLDNDVRLGEEDEEGSNKNLLESDEDASDEEF